MATVNREDVTIRIDSALFRDLRRIAEADGRNLDVVIEGALKIFAECRTPQIRPEVMARSQASMQRNYRLLELLAQHDTQESCPQ